MDKRMFLKMESCLKDEANMKLLQLTHQILVLIMLTLAVMGQHQTLVRLKAAEEE